MNLQLNKTRQELESIFKTAFKDNIWQEAAGKNEFIAGDNYPVITNERPVNLQSCQWGFPLYLDDNQTILKKITEVGIEWVFDKPLFESIETKRCLIPLQNNEANELSYGAGTWETFINQKGEEQKHFVLLTRSGKAASSREPFLLTGNLYRVWLGEKQINISELKDMLK